MKRSGLFCITVFMMLFIFTSCGDSNNTVNIDEMESMERAYFLCDLVDRNMSELDSYTEELCMQINTSVYDTSVAIISEGSAQTDNSSHKGVTYRCSLNCAAYLDSEPILEYERVEYYEAGIGYSFYRDEDKSLAFSAEMTTNEYSDYLAANMENMGNIEINEEIATTASTEKRDDGGWTILFSDFSSELVGAFLADIGLSEIVDDEIEDFTAIIEVSPEHLYESIRFEAIFEEGSTTSLTFTSQISSIDETEIIYDLHEIEFVEVCDLRAILLAQREHSKVVSSRQGQSELSITIFDRWKEESETLTEADTISYSYDDNGSFCYEVACRTGGNHYLIRYENNEKKTYEGVNVNQFPQPQSTVVSTDAIERGFINSFIDYASFNDEEIIAVEKITSSGGLEKYEYTIEVTNDMLSRFAIEGSYIYKSGEAKVILTFSNGSLLRYETEININFECRNFIGGYSYDIYDYERRITSSCTYSLEG